MKAVAIIILSSALAIGCFAAGGDSPVGAYRSEVGIYSLRIALLGNGNYLAQWDSDIGSNGTASGSWELVGDEVRLDPKKEEGAMMKGYLRVLLFREFHGRKALLRKEDAKEADNQFFYLYRGKASNQPSQPMPLTRHG